MSDTCPICGLRYDMTSSNLPHSHANPLTLDAPRPILYEGEEERLARALHWFWARSDAACLLADNHAEEARVIIERLREGR